MDFVRARTSQQIDHRKNDIINACDKLFEIGGYDNVNIKAISEITTITRSSIYTYYKTKDEIILDLLALELVEFSNHLLEWSCSKQLQNAEEFCKDFTDIIVKNRKMLSHYCLLYSFLEINCRLDNLVEFKNKAIPVTGTIVKTIQQNFTHITHEQAELITTEIVTYVLGLYPATHLTDKQKEAIALSKEEYNEADFSTLCYLGILAFLKTFA